MSEIAWQRSWLACHGCLPVRLVTASSGVKSAASDTCVCKCTTQILPNSTPCCCALQLKPCQAEYIWHDCCRFQQEQQAQPAQTDSPEAAPLQYTRMAAAEQHSTVGRHPGDEAAFMQQPGSRAQKPAQHALSELEQQGSLLSSGSAKSAPGSGQPDPQAQYASSTRQAAQRSLTEGEQQGSASNTSGRQLAATAAQPDLQSQSWYTHSSSSSRPAVQRPLSELEQHGGASPASAAIQQPNQQQPRSGRFSPNEAEHVATLRSQGSRSPTRDLTELEQQGSSSLAPDSNNLRAQSQAEQSPLGIAAAELALDMARHKSAQAELERQYSQLQLQHQQACP